MQIKTKNKKRQDPRSSALYLSRTDSDMIKIVREIQTGLLGIRSACFKYGLNRNTLKLFITKFSILNLDVEFSTKLLSTMNDDKKDAALNRKIRELGKDLEYAKLKIISLETMIKV